VESTHPAHIKSVGVVEELEVLVVGVVSTIGVPVLPLVVADAVETLHVAPVKPAGQVQLKAVRISASTKGQYRPTHSAASKNKAFPAEVAVWSQRTIQS
jgi:hypothetical protein